MANFTTSPISFSRLRSIAAGTDAELAVVRLAGEHDIATKVAVAVAIARAAEGDHADVVVDLSEVTFMDASTVGAIVGSRNLLRAHSHALAVRAPSPPALRILELCGLGHLIASEAAYPSLEAALGTAVEHVPSPTVAVHAATAMEDAARTEPKISLAMARKETNVVSKREEAMSDDIYELPDLEYDPGALEPHISGRIMSLHHDKHHAGYVKGANTALARLHDVRLTEDFTAISMLEKDLAFNVSGHVLHSVLWTNLSPHGGGEPAGDLAELIGATFGGFRSFRQQMTKAAATIQGSGWALASWEPVAGRLVVQQVFDHQGNHGQGTVPLLAIDAWEHAFYLQYENRKTDYLDAIWNVINWDDVARRLFDARGLAP
jgi:Fe-Mn family superoxide dismutase